MATPPAEVQIDEALVGRLLREQLPELAAADVRIVANGWDNAVVRVGDEWMMRLPRRAAAATLIGHEQRWLPELAPHLPLPIPVPTFCGQPDDGYPWPWSLCRWLPGRSAAAAPPVDGGRAATDLAAFLRALHRPAPADAPDNPVRGVPLRARATVVESRLAVPAPTVEPRRVLDAWNDLSATPIWDGPPMWLHGDLHPANMLTEEGRLAAVIDFGDITAGDPATDLAVAWTMFDEPQRISFRAAVGADDDTWRRAAGWALALALAYLTGDDDSPMPAIGRRTLAAVLAEFA
jgi:aminoglycoside phosphotransferase (APT) family kinase protein